MSVPLPHTERLFWEIMPIKSIVRFRTRVGLAWPCSTLHDTRTVLLPIKGMPLPLPFLWGRILFLTTRKLVCPLWWAKPARFCSQATWEDFECNPTSTREAPHSCLISTWHKHECTITTHKKALLRDDAHQEYCPLWGKGGIGLPMFDTTWYPHDFVTHEGHASTTTIFVGEDFVPGHPQACLSALGSQALMILFSSDMGKLWVQSHIGKRSAPLLPYKCLAQAWVYHYHV